MANPAPMKAKDHPFRVTGVEALTPPAWSAQLVSWVLVTFAVTAAVYASVASMDVVITGMGRVVPAGQTVIVQTEAPGVVHTVHAVDGAKVKAGDLLLDIRAGGSAVGTGGKPTTALTTTSQAFLDVRLLESLTKLGAAEAEVARRTAERESAAAAVMELEKSLTGVRKKYEMREGLAKGGHIAESTLIDSRLELINVQKEVHVQKNRLQEAEATLAAAIQARTQAETDYKARYPSELVEIARRATAVEGAGRPGRQELRAPADGIVRHVVTLAPGEPVSSAQSLMVIVPENAPLEVEALVFNKDIGHLKVGQPAVIKVETYDYTRYGHLDGTVTWIGQDALQDPKLGPVYAARIALKSFETPNTVNGIRGTLTPGMSVTADVKVTSRKMISYFLSPMLRAKEESLRER